MDDGKGRDVRDQGVGIEGWFLEAVDGEVHARPDVVQCGADVVVEVNGVGDGRKDEDEIWDEVSAEMMGDGMVAGGGALPGSSGFYPGRTGGGGGEVLGGGVERAGREAMDEDKVCEGGGKDEDDKKHVEEERRRAAEKEGADMAEELWKEVGGPKVEGKVRRAPEMPTKEEREAHEALHAEHRGWCRHCVRGRRRNQVHKARKGDREVREAGRVVRVSVDYNFCGRK